MDNWQKLKQDFLDRWTLQNIKNMSLVEYTNLNRDDSFTYWLESRTTDVLSIWGGSAYKFGIFKRDPQAEEKKLNAGQQSNGEYGWSTKFGTDKYRAFDKIKSLIIETVIAAQNSDFEKIDNIELGPAFKWKIAFMYAPDKSLLRIASNKTFQFLANKYNIQTKKISQIHKELITMKNNDEDFYSYSSRLWDEYSQNDNKRIDPINLKELTMPKSPLNQILYGPPGTGKTYKTVDKALEIIFEKESKNQFFDITSNDKKYSISYEDALKRKDRGALTAIFDFYKKSGQIEFITFHQSYGYEEFVEGIKAIPVGKIGNEDGNEMIYDVVPGCFKRLSLKAQKEQMVSHNPQLKRYKLNAPTINIQAQMVQDDENSFRVLKGSKIRKAQTPSFSASKLKEEILAQIKTTEENEYFILEEDYTFQSMSASSSVILGRASSGYADWREIHNENTTTQIEKKENQKQNHILIIDEINRGNISKIFGELITLIEPSKRIGEEEEIRVKLPYSDDNSELFGVPSNLYIIGTMNTADRSIAQIDTALRRRFVFEEMMPQSQLLKNITIENSNINLVKILDAINERIEYIYDREHTIGHSYFLPLIKTPSKNSLDEIFRVNIIPLLTEYFYADWSDIEFILNNNFIQEKKKKEYIKETSREFNRVYQINTEFKTTEYIKIYNGDEE